MSRRTAWLTRVAIAALLALGAVAVRHAWRCLTHPYPLEYGEGVNLLWARRVAQGLPLYPPVSDAALPWLHNPYPPLGPALIATLSAAGLDAHPFLAGRLLSLAGLLLAAGAMGGLVRRRASGRTAALAVAVFLLSPVVFRFGPLMRIDPFALGLALQAVNLADRRRTAPWLALAGLLAATALLAKPAFIAAGLALLLVTLRRRAWPAAGAALAGASLPLLIAAVLLWRHESPQLGLHLVTLNALPLDPVGAFGWLALFAAAHAPAIAGAATRLRRASSDARPAPPADLLRVYAGCCLIAPLAGGLVTGSAEHYLLELWAVIVIAAALTWHRLNATRPATAGLLLLMQAALFLPLPPAPVFTRTYGQEIPAGSRAAWTPGRADTEIGRLIRSELETTDGPILGSDLGFILLAGHDAVYQPYQFGQLDRAGRFDPGLLGAAIADGQFPVILLKGDAEHGDDPTFSPGLQPLIHATYELHRVIGPWHLYRRW